ncbi:MAG TPA: membrane protein insertase YidC [Stellaceae bacterium]|jgi:YidC/Oxa1 family membrane protein insertase|nr:membrane protein insertase YidC [Stellaceae bacterium]
MEQRNLLLAIVVSVGILIGFQYLFEKLRPPPPPTPAVPTQTVPAPAPGANVPGSTAPGTATPGNVPAPGATVAGAAPAAETREQAIAEQPRIKIDTPRLHGSVALTGGRIDDLTLATYHETTDPHSPEVVLLWPTGTKEPYFAEFGWVAGTSGLKVPGPDTRWTASDGTLTPNSPLTLTWDNGAGLVFTRVISVDENYMFTVRDSVRNAGNAPVSLLPYSLISRTGTPHVSGYYILHEGLIGELGGSLREVKYSALSPDKPDDFTSTGGWLGFTDKYWLTALVPDQKEEIKARLTHQLENGVDRYQSDFLGSSVTIPADGTASTSTRFFAGAKEVNLLDAYAASGIPHFDLAIDFGWFYFLTKPIFLALQFFYGILGNFGLAILLLTLIIKLLFFPLANKSYKAMSKMKLLQPEMQKIRERFPDDKARQQQEIMAMYKRVGANPLAGCLPIVIQIPVFFSLYKVLFVTIEMRHAPFFGWIHDLSAPDPTSFANLFGLLPFAPPTMLMIGAWPLIMGVTMFLQQKLNPQPVDPVQARMFMFLPIVFTYMLSAFPAGLVIYWAWNNLLSITQQWVIMHRAGAA